jgi:hypothetical protein
VRLAAVALALIVGCGGTETAKPNAPHDPPGRASAAAGPSVLEPDPGPPPARDCKLLQPSIERIIAAEIAIIERDRPDNVAPVAIAEAKATGALLVAVLPARCEADRWSGAYTTCIAAGQTRDDARACEVHLTLDQQTALAEAIRSQVGVQGALGISECDEWERITMKIATCDKFPESSRQALVQGVRQTMDAWRNQALGAESRSSIQTACRSALDAMKQSMQSLGCPQ